jgi:hypothetical protein
VLVDLLPWLKQYHGAIDPEFGISMADSFASFVATEGQRLGKSQADLAAWTPPPKAKRVKKAATKRPSKKQLRGPEPVEGEEDPSLARSP